jgi:phenylpropionate dioxygenase-like ring-hydroxylating dioxygenase large terminal subunit
MEPANARRFAELLRATAGDPLPGSAAGEGTFAVPAERYRDATWCARDLAICARSPRIAAVSSEIAAGSSLPCDVPGLALLLVRDRDGVLRGFHNACRHRGTRLCDAAGAAKAFVCPYHGWTYDLAGALIHVPHEVAFPGLLCADRGLRAIPVVERDGLVWIGADASAFAAPITADLAALDLDRHVVWRRSHGTRRCNWKLVIEAFLDGYHLRVLHRDSIYRFFVDGASVTERAGPHIRAMTARRSLLEGAPSGDIRLFSTPSYLVFPGTVIIEHPDFVSIITVSPQTAATCSWDHAMLVPSERRGEDEHWQRSWTLIEETVFQREDLWVCEQIQRSIDAGATDELLFGALEHSVRWFHDALSAAS